MFSEALLDHVPVRCVVHVTERLLDLGRTEWPAPAVYVGRRLGQLEPRRDNPRAGHLFVHSEFSDSLRPRLAPRWIHTLSSSTRPPRVPINDDPQSGGERRCATRPGRQLDPVVLARRDENFDAEVADDPQVPRSTPSILETSSVAKQGGSGRRRPATPPTGSRSERRMRQLRAEHPARRKRDERFHVRPARGSSAHHSTDRSHACASET